MPTTNLKKPANATAAGGSANPRTAARAIIAGGHHAITFTGGGGWELWHPDRDGACSGNDRCPAWAAAQRTLLAANYMPGTYHCGVDRNGWLRTWGGRHQ